MPQIKALVASVKSGLGFVKLVSCSGVHSLTSISRPGFDVSTVGVIAVRLLLEEVGLIL